MQKLDFFVSGGSCLALAGNIDLLHYAGIICMLAFHLNGTCLVA